jgi:hypothetical protein
MTDWRDREHASSGARWLTAPPFDLDRASDDQLQLDEAPDGLVRAYAEKNSGWREPDRDLDREGIEHELDRDL